MKIKKIILIILFTLLILVPTLFLAGFVANRNIEKCERQEIKSSLDCFQQARDDSFIPFISIMFFGFLFYSVSIICVLREENENQKK